MGHRVGAGGTTLKASEIVRPTCATASIWSRLSVGLRACLQLVRGRRHVAAAYGAVDSGYHANSADATQIASFNSPTAAGHYPVGIPSAAFKLVAPSSLKPTNPATIGFIACESVARIVLLR